VPVAVGLIENLVQHAQWPCEGLDGRAEVGAELPHLFLHQLAHRLHNREVFGVQPGRRAEPTKAAHLNPSRSSAASNRVTALRLATIFASVPPTPGSPTGILQAAQDGNQEAALRNLAQARLARLPPGQSPDRSWSRSESSARPAHPTM
jgi:hypothetical protein